MIKIELQIENRYSGYSEPNLSLKKKEFKKKEEKNVFNNCDFKTIIPIKPGSEKVLDRGGSERTGLKIDGLDRPQN
jgi:hypothetical protein